MKGWLLNHSVWIKVIAPVITSLSLKFLNYDVSSIEKTHPFKFHVLHTYLIPVLPWMLGASIFTFAYILFIEERAKPKIKELSEKLASSEEKNKIISERVRDLFDGYLYNLAGMLAFGTRNTNCERITLYIHDTNNTFIPFGRYSANPEYKSTTRTSYSDLHGCIAEGWRNGWHFDSAFPCPQNDNNAYIDYHATTYKMPRAITRKIKMASRIYAVMSIKIKSDSLAVIVVESVRNDRFNELEVKKILESQNDFLGHSIKELLDYIPRPSNASSMGL